MEIILKSEYTDNNKFCLYSYKYGKKKKLRKGFFKDDSAVTINVNDNSDKYILFVYPKYYSKLGWLLLWLLLCFVELISTCFAFFGSDTKMYKSFSFEIPKEIDEVEFTFNRPRYDLICSNNNIVIKESKKGRLFSILISLAGVLVYILIIFLMVLLNWKI